MSTEVSRRNSTRYSLKLPVTVVVRGDVLAGVSRNISTGGMFVELVESPTFGPSTGLVDESVTLTVELPCQPLELIVDAQVRWSNGNNGIGLRFLSLDGWEEQALGRLFVADSGDGARLGESEANRRAEASRSDTQRSSL